MSCDSGFTINLLASVEYTANGSATDFSFSFPFLNQNVYIDNYGTASKSSYIRVFLIGGDSIVNEVTSGITMPTDSSIRFATAPANGLTVRIRRDSDIVHPEFNAVDGSPMTGEDENFQFLKNFYLLQEENDNLYYALCGITNATPYAGNVYTKTGDGSWTTFTLTDGTNTEAGLSVKQVIVHSNGVYQQESTYTAADVAGVTVLTFSSAPSTGYIVEVRVIHSATVPNLTLGNGTVTCDTLAAGSICGIDKFDLDSLGTNKYILGFLNPDTAFGIYPLDPTWIIGFDTQVQASRLDQFDAPTSPVDMNNQKIINVATPTNANDAVNKTYVDTAITGVGAARVSTQFVNLPTAGIGYTLNAGFDYTSVNIQLLLISTFYSFNVTTLDHIKQLAPYLNKTYFSSGITAFTQFFFNAGFAFSLQKTGNALTVGTNLGGGYLSMVVTFYKDG